MEPARPFHIQIDSITLAENFGGNSTLQFDNLQALMHFVFSLDPHQLLPFDQSESTHQVVLHIEQEGSELGNIRIIKDATEGVGKLQPGMYLTFYSGMNSIWGVTGFNFQLLESNTNPTGTIQLAEYYPESNQFEWATGYAHLKQQVLSTLGNDKSLPHPFVATVTIHGHDYSDQQKRQDFRACHYFPSLADAVKKALSTNFSEFQPQLIYSGNSAISSVSLHTTDLLSADFYLSRSGIESVVAGDGPPVAGIYLTFDMDLFPEPEDIERKFGWDLKKFECWFPEMYAILISRETYDEGYELTHDPYLYPVVVQNSENTVSCPYQLEVSGTYYLDDMSAIPPNFTNVYHYANFQDAMDHLLSINPRSLDLQQVMENKEKIFIRTAKLQCPQDIRYELVVTRDFHNKWKMGSAGAFLIREPSTLISNPEFYQDIRFAPVLQLASYSDNSKELRSFDHYLVMQNNAIALQSSVALDKIVSRFRKASPAVEQCEVPVLPGFFRVVITGRMDITGVEQTICDSFEAAYKHLAELPVAALLRSAPGGYEDAKVFDHNGALLVSRYDHPGDAIIPAGIYTIVHCENLSSDVLRTLSADLKIIGSHDEKFICRSASESSLQIQLRSSPLRVADIKNTSAGPHM